MFGPDGRAQASAVIAAEDIAAPIPAAEPDFYDKLLKLDDLRKRGILTDAEFEAEKKKLLEGN